MKRFLAVILTVCLCFTAVFTLASCGCEKEEPDTRVINTEPTDPDMTDENGFGYVISDDSKSLSIILYTGSSEEIEIPSEYSGKPVTEISKSVFRNKNITSVTIPASIEKIGNRAFSNCAKLVNVNFSEGLKEIDNFAFSYCSKLAKVTLPESLTRLGEYAFTSSGLESCVIPSGITELENFVFFQCKKLTTVMVPSTVKNFGKDVFGDDENLTITGESGSPIEKYAEEGKINFEAAQE